MKLQQRQNIIQKLALTQQMRNSLSLLIMGPEELSKTIEEEIKRNPFLKAVPALPLSYNSEKKPQYSEVDNLYSDQSGTDALKEQISLLKLDACQRKVAHELIHCLDSRGFIAENVDEMCYLLNTTKGNLLKLVGFLQKVIEPCGVFAWSLKDCFRIQLEDKNRYDPIIAQLLDRLDLVATRDINQICSICEVDREDAVEMLNDIRSLSPAPFQPSPKFPEVKKRVADLIFRKEGENSISVKLNEMALPKILTDDGLFSAIKETEMEKKTLQYYRDCYRNAANFVIAMQKRANTLLKIGKLVAKKQRKFIRTARSVDKKPLTMGAIAKELGLNKSTISRALRDCVIETETGLINAIDCFARSLNDESTERTREQVMRRLSLLLRTEDRKAPFTDSELVKLLAKANFKVARRTVVKYRNSLGFKGAYVRRVAE